MLLTIKSIYLNSCLMFPRLFQIPVMFYSFMPVGTSSGLASFGAACCQGGGTNVSDGMSHFIHKKQGLLVPEMRLSCY